MTRSERRAVVDRHVARQWEQFCRERHPAAGRYWEGDVELDAVWRQKTTRRYIVAECKWMRLKPHEAKGQLTVLQNRFAKSKLSRTLDRVDFQLLTQEDLPKLLQDLD